MLKSASKAPRPLSGSKVVQLPLPRFVRPSEQFETRPSVVKTTTATGNEEGV